MPSSTPLTPEQFRRRLLHVVTIGLAQLEAEIMRRSLSFCLKSAVSKSPYLTGRYRGSHRVSAGTPEVADLKPAPAYPIPDDLHVDAAMAGYTPGTPGFVTNDAKSAEGYVYALNVEELGWGPRAAYRVYERTNAELQGKMPEMARGAVEYVSRKNGW